MTGFSIGEVAKRAGLRASALRYYEQVGLIPPQLRVSGRRKGCEPQCQRTDRPTKARDHDSLPSAARGA